MQPTFSEPSLIVENISNKPEQILGTTVRVGRSVDLFKVIANLSESRIIDELHIPHGEFYLKTVVRAKFLITKLELTQLQLVADNLLSLMSPASASSDGYLLKEDWSRFNSGSSGVDKPDVEIWQYQDFSAPVSSSLTLNTFSNGTGLSFNSSYIVSSTAVIVLASNNSLPPTTTIATPGRWDPANRVSVSTHSGANIVLNQAPQSGLICRIWFLILLPAAAEYPTGYVEAPQFVNSALLDGLDDIYNNQESDETIYGIKTYNGQPIFNSSVKIPLAAADGYLLTSDTSGNATWQSPNLAGGISAIQHRTLRQLIHLANNGPFEGFATGAFKETLPIGSPFPTSFIWYTDSSKTSKIVEKFLTYGNIKAKIDQIQYKVYDIDGTTILATVTDTPSYSGIFETSRIRTIA